jgi:hypothetical protein
MTKKAPWTTEENAALCVLYFAMLDKAKRGESYNKAAMVRAAISGIGPRDLSHDTARDFADFAGKLANRSRGSIEAKLMNASAAHRDLNQASGISGYSAITMDGYGYRCLSNYQAALKAAMTEALKARYTIRHPEQRNQA